MPIGIKRQKFREMRRHGENNREMGR